MEAPADEDAWAQAAEGTCLKSHASESALQPQGPLWAPPSANAPTAQGQSLASMSQMLE